MKKEEIWIKNDPRYVDVEEIEKFILSLADEKLLGEIPVIIYRSDTKSDKRLSHIYDVDISAINVLREKYGDENVKHVE